MKGEKWKDIPDLEGDYCVSNLGRVKRNDLEVVHKNGKVCHLKARIMVPEVGMQKNQSVGDTNYFLRVKIRRQKVHYEYSLPRLLYCLFVRKFDLKDYSLVVLAKDGNGRNLSLKNLALVDIRRKQLRIFERDRLHRSFYYTYDEFLETGSASSVNPACKQVTQYSLAGELMRTFPSIRDAALTSGVPEAGIIPVLKKRSVSAYGYVWDYGKKTRIDVAAIRQARKDNYKKLRGRPVTQYTVKGKRVATYIAVADAARATNVNKSDIFGALSGKQQTAGGFIWKRGAGGPSIDVTGFVYGEVLRSMRRWKPVKQYIPDGKTHIKTYPSVNAAARAMGCAPSGISTALGNKKALAKGFVWKV